MFQGRDMFVLPYGLLYSWMNEMIVLLSQGINEMKSTDVSYVDCQAINFCYHILCPCVLISYKKICTFSIHLTLHRGINIMLFNIKCGSSFVTLPCITDKFRINLCTMPSCLFIICLSIWQSKILYSGFLTKLKTVQWLFIDDVRLTSNSCCQKTNSLQMFCKYKLYVIWNSSPKKKFLFGKRRRK